MELITGLLVILIFGGLYITSYYLNLKTPKPENYIDSLDACSSCNVTSCTSRDGKEKKWSLF